MAHVEMTSAPPTRLVLRFADVGVATYASLRVVGEPARTVTWVVEEPFVLAAIEQVADALPSPRDGETMVDALRRSLLSGPFSDPSTELRASYHLGLLLLSQQAWSLLLECVAAVRPVLHLTPTARLAQIPFALLALPSVYPTADQLVRAKAGAVSATGEVLARLPWKADDLTAYTEGYRLMELVDLVMSPPANIVNAPRRPARWEERRTSPPVLILDPRVPGQTPSSPLGSVLGRPSPDSLVSEHFAGALARHTVYPPVSDTVELFRRRDTDRNWLSVVLQDKPSRMLFVGHASAASSEVGYAERSALHLSCTALHPGLADPVGSHRPWTAADLLADTGRWPMPPRVALVACASGTDHRFDEPNGLVAAMILAGSELVTATLWSLPTTAGYRSLADGDTAIDPMGELIAAVDSAHESDDPVVVLGRWQRAQMRRWRSGDVTAHPVFWASLVTFAVPDHRA
ncbi:hypothetical protein W823_06855 [Williamsia sp. D3]|nr:hypothetical protein W823_06855 [Williamsia sp. D3]